MSRRNKEVRQCVALLGGTSSEYLGRRPLPRLLNTRPFVLILGPRGVGKTAVAKRILGRNTLTLKGEALHAAAASAVRRRKWPEAVAECEYLLIDGPTLLSRRPGVTRLLQHLISSRSEKGLRTVVCQGEGDDSVLLLTDEMDESTRVTLNLRYPQGRGRVRFAVRVCEELGLDRKFARIAQPEEPWTYLKVIRALKRMQREEAEMLSGEKHDG